MRLYSIENVKENMQLAKNIYTNEGNILLASGVTLNARYIKRLKEIGIASLYIYDEKVGQIEVDELVKEQTKAEVFKVAKETMNTVSKGNSIDGDKIKKVINNLMEDLIINRNVIVNLAEIRALNDYTFGHCVMVCIYSLMMGISSGFDYHRLKHLGTGALLHDIGKVLISDELLHKPGMLTPVEFAEVQKHSQYGFEMMQKNDEISILSAHVALQHHERYDGSGYPRGLKGEEIHEFARITAIADVYDFLSTDVTYRKRFLTSDILDYIKNSRGKYFDPWFADKFLEKIAPFPIGTMVLLNNGEKGIVVKVPSIEPAKPLVRILYDSSGKELTEIIDRDLTKELSLKIEKVIKE